MVKALILTTPDERVFYAFGKPLGAWTVTDLPQTFLRPLKMLFHTGNPIPNGVKLKQRL
jgi:hypothetical protein